MKTSDEALLAAIEKKDVKAASGALTAGADPSAKTVTHMPALNMAVTSKSKTLVKLLVGAGADVNAVDRKGSTALYLMADTLPDLALGKLLLDKGADPNKLSGESAPLHRAVKRPKLDFAELLLAGGANVNLQDVEGNTPLHVVLQGGTWEMTSTDIAATKWLLEKGADVHVVDKTETTPLLVAAESGHDKGTFDALFARGAKLTTDKYGHTALHLAVGHTSCDHTWLWDLLLAKGCDINALDNEGETPLARATVHWNATAVRHLLEKGADPNVKNKKGETALDNAKHCKMTKIIPLLESAMKGK